MNRSGKEYISIKDLAPSLNSVWRKFMTQGQIINIKSIKHRFPIVCEYAGGRFRLTEEGVTFLGNDKDGNPLAPRWICSPLYVVAKTRDAKSGE